MHRIIARGVERLIDATILSIAYWLAFQLRFDLDIPEQFFKRALFLWPYVVILQYLGLAWFGIPRFSWPYVGLRETIRIATAFAATSSVLLAVRLIVGAFFNPTGLAQYALIPIGVIVIDSAMAFLGVVAVRFTQRLLKEHGERREHTSDVEPVATLLIGAGEAGLMVAKEISDWPGLGFRPVGFLDDDTHKLGMVLHGLKVLGNTRDLPRLIQRHGIRQCIITIANAPGRDIRRISSLCETAGVPVKIIPGIFEILGGRVGLNRIRDVSVEDLLRREVVKLDSEKVAELIRDKIVLVTGAGGSIGSEISRQVAALAPRKLLLLERLETSLDAICRNIDACQPAASFVVPLLTDVADGQRLDAIFEQHTPQLVFHAAAHKHVPMMEWNPGEAIRNNVFGTETLARMSDRHGVETFVLISTDKAVNPSSIMGATKRVAELVVQALSTTSKSRYVSVRFGNVLDSAGSVIPIFKQQIQDGGPVTVTHPEMKRYFMTIPEATQLVLQSATLGRSGDIFVLDMGEPVKILDLARDLIRLSGFEPGKDIPIVFTGTRPGEKLFEELGFDPGTMARTRHPHIFVVSRPPAGITDLAAALAQLADLVDCDDPVTVRSALHTLVPEMQEPDVELSAIASGVTGPG